MSEQLTRIEDVQERVQDFVKALRRAGANDVAARIEEYAAGFTDTVGVRRSVAAIQQQLEYWRTYPDQLPDLPIIHVAANRLEDVCKEALRAGVIQAARPSLRTSSKRNFTVALAALAAGGLMFLLPLLITMFGIDLTDPHLNRELPKVRVAQGEEIQVGVNVLVETAEPAVTRGVDIHIADRCRKDLRDGASCRMVEPHEFEGGSLPTVEVMLPDQAYGLLVGVGNQRVVGRAGMGTVFIAATDDTPEGTYRLPLQGAFIGYTPEHCTPFDRLRDTCTRRTIADDALHDGLPVPLVVVEVVRGDPSRRLTEQKRREAEEAALKKKAAERAEQIANAVTAIKAALDDTQKLLTKKRFQEGRDRIVKLNQLFAPLDTLMVDDAGLESMPVEVAELRVRFDGQRTQLDAFEGRVFEEQYALVTAPANKDRAEDALLAESARKNRISPEYAQEIFAAHAEEMERRLAEVEKARLAELAKEHAELEARCGGLPTGLWKTVNDYLHLQFTKTRIKLSDCLTPRLDPRLCWTAQCVFTETIPTDESQPDIVYQHKWTFVLRSGQIEGVSERLVKR